MLSSAEYLDMNLENYLDHESGIFQVCDFGYDLFQKHNINPASSISLNMVMYNNYGQEAVDLIVAINNFQFSK